MLKIVFISGVQFGYDLLTHILEKDWKISAIISYSSDLKKNYSDYANFDLVAKKYNVKVYGGNTNNSESWWGVRENYEGKTGNFTTYNNYKGETWTENY